MANFSTVSAELSALIEQESDVSLDSDSLWPKLPGQISHIGTLDPTEVMAGRILRSGYYQSLLAGSSVDSLAESMSRLTLSHTSEMIDSLASSQRQFEKETKARDRQFALLEDAAKAASPTKREWTNPFDQKRIADWHHYHLESRMQESIANAHAMAWVVERVSDALGTVVDLAVVKPSREVCQSTPHIKNIFERTAEMFKSEAKWGVDIVESIHRAHVRTTERVMVPLLQEEYGISPDITRQYMADIVTVAPELISMGALSRPVKPIVQSLRRAPEITLGEVVRDIARPVNDNLFKKRALTLEDLGISRMDSEIFSMRGDVFTKGTIACKDKTLKVKVDYLKLSRGKISNAISCITALKDVARAHNLEKIQIKAEFINDRLREALKRRYGDPIETILEERKGFLYNWDVFEIPVNK